MWSVLAISLGGARRGCRQVDMKNGVAWGRRVNGSRGHCWIYHELHTWFYYRRSEMTNYFNDLDLSRLIRWYVMFCFDDNVPRDKASVDMKFGGHWARVQREVSNHELIWWLLLCIHKCLAQAICDDYAIIFKCDTHWNMSKMVLRFRVQRSSVWMYSPDLGLYGWSELLQSKVPFCGYMWLTFGYDLYETII